MTEHFTIPTEKGNARAPRSPSPRGHAMTRPRTERITVSLPPDIAAYARLCAEMQGRSVSAFIAETIQQRLGAGLAGLNAGSDTPRDTTHAVLARSPHAGRPG